MKKILIAILPIILFTSEISAEEILSKKNNNVVDQDDFVIEENIDQDDFAIGNNVDDLSGYKMHIKIKDFFIKGEKYFFKNKDDLYFIGKNNISEKLEVISKTVKINNIAVLNEIVVKEKENKIEFLFDNDVKIILNNLKLEEDLSIIKKEIDEVIFFI